MNLIVEMVSWVYSMKFIRLYTGNMCSLFYDNYIPTKQFCEVNRTGVLTQEAWSFSRASWIENYC